MIQVIIFWLLGIIYRLRRALPLYMNDHARIASLYAWSLLAVFQSSQKSPARKFKYLQIFARHFSLPVSVGRLAETVYADPKRREFEAYCTERLSTGSVHPNTKNILTRLPLALSRIPQDSKLKAQSSKEKLFQPQRPDLAAVFARLNFNKEASSQEEKFSLVAQYEDIKRDKAILILPLGKIEQADMAALRGFRHITVMPQTASNFKQIKSQLHKALGEDVAITLYEPTSRHAAPYSPGNVYISGFCDALANQTLETGLRHRAVRRFIPEVLRDDVSLMISDVIYRPVQTFYATLRAVETCAEDAAIFYLGPAKSLPRTLSRSNAYPVFVMTHGTNVETDHDIIHHRKDRRSNKQVIKDIRRAFKYLSARSFAAAPKIDRSGSAHIYIATNTWSSTYAKAADLITKKLENIATVSVFDYAAPAGMHKNIQASLTPCLHNALLSTRSSDISLISQYINLADAISPEKLAIGTFPALEMKELLVKALQSELGAIIGNILLFKKMRQELSAVTNALLVQCPGRFGNIRCLGHAFQDAGLPTLDVQALFVTEMARYRPPMAKHMTVIDSFAQDLYASQWNVELKNMTPIGSVLLDEDIKAALAGDAATFKQAHLSGNQRTVISYASQPLPDREVMEAIKVLAHYMKDQTDKHLCIKLHPIQDEVTQNMIESYLQDTLSDVTSYTVLKKPPFSEVMPFTDILISYFSNVCLLAPAFNTPVVTLPTSVPVPAVTLAHMGLATHVDNYAELGTTLNTLLNGSEKDLYTTYLSKNPHMTQLSALAKLSALAEGQLKASSNQRA